MFLLGAGPHVVSMTTAEGTRRDSLWKVLVRTSNALHLWSSWGFRDDGWEQSHHWDIINVHGYNSKLVNGTDGANASLVDAERRTSMNL